MIDGEERYNEDNTQISGPVLPRAVVAYDAPDGAPIGALDSGRAYIVIARWGDGWLQADVAGSGLVWLRVSDLLDTNNVADIGSARTTPPPDSQPQAPMAIWIAPTPEPVYQVANDPPAPAYEPMGAPQAAGAAPATVWASVPPVVRADDFTASDPEAKCAFVGCLPGR